MEASALNELLECSVCFEVLDQSSKVLPCQHTFCRQCLEAIAASKHQELICPECRAVVRVPIKDLPSNVLLVRLLESMKISSTPPSPASSAAAPPPFPSPGTAAAKGTSASPSKRNHHHHRRSVIAAKSAAVALFDYAATSDGDLGLTTGDRVHLTGRVDDDWLRGECNGARGVFPASYVQIVVPLNDRPHTCKALFDFTARSSKENHCLFFKKGEIITVIRKVDLNWVEGELKGLIGMFPKSFVEFDEHSCKFLGITHNLRSQKVAVSSGVCMSPGVGCGGHVSTTDVMTAIPKVYSAPSINTTPACVTLTTATSTTTSTTTTTPSVPTNKRHSVVSNRWSTDIGPTMVNGGNTLLYQALYNYKPQKPDELELVKNDLYHVTEHCRDGWYKGYSQSLQHGVFPGNYAKLFSPPTTDMPVSVSHTKMITNVTQAVSRSLQASCRSAPSSQCSTSTSASYNTPKLCHRLSSSENHWYPCTRTGTSTEEAADVSAFKKQTSCASKLEKKRKNFRSVIINRLSNPNIEFRTNKSPVDSNHPPVIERKYKCIASYPAQSANEITLTIGDTLNVVEKRADGWMKGIQKRTGKTGFFPATFVLPSM